MESKLTRRARKSQNGRPSSLKQSKSSQRVDASSAGSTHATYSQCYDRLSYLTNNPEPSKLEYPDWLKLRPGYFYHLRGGTPAERFVYCYLNGNHSSFLLHVSTMYGKMIKHMLASKPAGASKNDFLWRMNHCYHDLQDILMLMADEDGINLVQSQLREEPDNRPRKINPMYEEEMVQAPAFIERLNRLECQGRKLDFALIVLKIILLRIVSRSVLNSEEPKHIRIIDAYIGVFQRVYISMNEEEIQQLNQVSKCCEKPLRMLKSLLAEEEAFRGG